MRRRVLSVLLLALALSGCTFGGGGDKAKAISVFDVKPGECFTAPTQVVQQLADLTEVPCTSAHTLESYASVDYKPAAGTSSDVYPGDTVLNTYADGVCAQKYSSYVGIDYRDSAYFYTYLLPSPRSWQQKDRTVLCFITTTGKTLTASLKGAKQ